MSVDLDLRIALRELNDRSVIWMGWVVLLCNMCVCVYMSYVRTDLTGLSGCFAFIWIRANGASG